MAREIKTTLMVDGEAAFRQAINQANTSMKNLGTQLTLAQAKFKQDGDAMKLMETRSKTLRSEVSQQEEIVNALKKAVEESTTAYGENSTKTEKWEAELNRAEAKLISLQNELTLNDAGLDRNGDAFDDAAQNAADYKATIDGIGKNVSFEAITNGISGVTGTMEAAIKKAVSFAKAVKDTMVDAGHWADDLITDATKYGVSVEELQRMQFASTMVDTSVETITTAQDKLEQKMEKGWKDGDIDMWQMLGIDVKDAETGKYRDTMSLLFEVGETLQNVAKIDGNDVRADTWAMELFGKSYKELLPLFTAGEDAWNSYMDSASVVSESNVQALGDMDDANEKLQNSWEALKYSALSTLAPAFTEVSNALSSLLDEFNEWMATDEGKETMQGLADALRELFSSVTNIKFGDAVEAVKTALNGIKDGLIWIKDNKDGIETAIKIIAGAFTLLKLGDLASNIMKIKNGLQGIWNTTGNGNGGTPTPTGTGGGNGGSPVASPTGTAVGTGGAAATGSSFWSTFGSVAGDAAAAVIPAVVMAGIVDNVISTENMLREWSEAGQEQLEEFNRISGSSQGSKWYGMWSAVANEMTANGNANPEEEEGGIRELAQEYMDWLTGGSGEGNPLFDELAEKMTDEQFDDLTDAFTKILTYSGDELNEGGTREAILSTLSGLQSLLEEEMKQETGGDVLEDAVSEMKVNTEASSTAAKKVSETDLNKQMNNSIPSLKQAINEGVIDGMSGITLSVDGYALANALTPYINTKFGTMVK